MTRNGIIILQQARYLVMQKAASSLLSLAALLLASPLISASELTGWASVEAHGLKTTTGGGDAAPLEVTTLAQLKSAMRDDAPRVVVLKGVIQTGPKPLEIRSHKTLRGADKTATLHGGIKISNASNVIVRNLHIQGAGVGNDPADAIAVRGSHHLWFDHLNVWNSRDGNLDLTNGTDCVTVSWCKFWYGEVANDHRLACLVGGGSTHGETDLGKNRVTYHHNWFADLVRERMPRVLFGQCHIFNNLYTCTGNNYCIGAGSFASVLIEGNCFQGVKDPHKFADGNHAFITARDNLYEATKGKQETGLGGTEGPVVEAFTQPPYAYKTDAAKDLPDRVMKGAGPQ